MNRKLKVAALSILIGTLVLFVGNGASRLLAQDAGTGTNQTTGDQGKVKPDGLVVDWVDIARLVAAQDVLICAPRPRERVAHIERDVGRRPGANALRDSLFGFVCDWLDHANLVHVDVKGCFSVSQSCN